MRTAVLAALLLLPPLPAAAQGAVSTVQDVLGGCAVAANARGASKAGSLSAAFCMGLSAGVAQILSFNCEKAAQGFNSHPQLRAANPPSRAAAAQAFVDWANANPDKWDWHFSLGMVSALTEAFPCPN